MTHDRRPQATGRAVFSHLFEEVVVRVEEETETRRERVELESGRERRFDVGNAVREGEGDLLYRRGAGFADVVAGDGDGVPVGHLLRAVGERVHDEAHRGTRGVDVGSARDVLLQDVVLNRAA